MEYQNSRDSDISALWDFSHTFWESLIWNWKYNWEQKTTSITNQLVDLRCISDGMSASVAGVENRPWKFDFFERSKNTIFLGGRKVKVDSLRPHGLYSPWCSQGPNTGVGSCSLLQGIFPTQGPNPGLPHWRQILYQLSYQRCSCLKKKKNYILFLFLKNVYLFLFIYLFGCIGS